MLRLLHTRRWRGNVFGRGCLSVCVSVCPVRALTFQSLDLETSSLVGQCTYILRISRWNHRAKVKISETKMSLESNQISLHAFAVLHLQLKGSLVTQNVQAISMRVNRTTVLQFDWNYETKMRKWPSRCTGYRLFSQREQMMSVTPPEWKSVSARHVSSSSYLQTSLHFTFWNFVIFPASCYEVNVVCKCESKFWRWLSGISIFVYLYMSVR